MDNKHKSLRRDGIIVMDDVSFSSSSFSYSVSVESFLKFIKGSFHITNITKENVNNYIKCPKGVLPSFTCLIEMITPDYVYYKYVFPYFLSLGVTITNRSFLGCDHVYIRPLLEYGFDTNRIISPCLRIGRDIFLLIDFGAKIPDWTKTEVEHYKIEEIEAYASLSDRRVQECRKALLTLLRACTESSSYSKGPFGGGAAFGGGAGFAALRDMMIQMTYQVWRIRGGEGCGPRGHKWI